MQITGSWQTRPVNKERVHQRLRPFYPDWDDGSRSVEAPCERHSVPGKNTILKETAGGKPLRSEDSYGRVVALCRTMFSSDGTHCFRPGLIQLK